MPKYKPGQFIKVDIPGRYRASKVLKLGCACITCDIKNECVAYKTLNDRSPFGINCDLALGVYGNVKKVK